MGWIGTAGGAILEDHYYYYNYRPLTLSEDTGCGHPQPPVAWPATVFTLTSSNINHYFGQYLA